MSVSSGEMRSSSFTPCTSVLANGRTRLLARYPATTIAARTRITAATVDTGQLRGLGWAAGLAGGAGP